MHKRFYLFFGILTLLAPLGAGQLFWLVETESSSVYLLGSLHAGIEDFYPLPQVITDAYATADYLVVEADVSEAKQMELAGKIAMMAMYQGDETLSDHLSEETIARADKRLRQYGLNAEMMAGMKPWMVGMTIISLEMQKLGFDANLGIDMHFLERATRDSTQIVEIEGLEYQINLFNDFDDEMQEKFLLDILDNQTEALRMLETMATAWQDGDEAKLEALILEESNDPEMSELYETLIYQRNDEMTAKIAKYLESGETWFVIVGAGHLVGDRGVVRLLSDGGYDVRKL
ncbi:MAG: TraB/GumN family protein [Candidatus Cloacimonetes bacterium]|nr:TraB/GumN family protein [Candidatus Cloacimonadota bacterium]